MPSDRSRRADHPRFGYTGVVAQQGRVILDRDLNAQNALVADRITDEAIDVIGPCGTPDQGFCISLPSSGSPPTYWNPPAGVPAGASPPYTEGGPRDFLISPGTMYVGGQRAVFYSEQNGKPVTYSYFDQPDWPSPARPADAGRELVYLELTELEVSAVEDPDLLEVALGGPDTTQRLKLLRRVRRLAVQAADCEAAWNEAVAHWEAEGLAFDPATMRLVPQLGLEVGFTQAVATRDPCDPVATGGYLGSDNQLIRVRTVVADGVAHLIWGYDNASFLYRITSVSPDRTMLTLAADPPDGFHVPQTGQLVEVLCTAAVLAEEPDETDPTGQAQILRVAAEPAGVLRRLAQPYGTVTPGDPTNYIVLSSALPSDVASSALPLFLRVWQAELPLPDAGGTVTIEDPTTGISTGVTATISMPANTPSLADRAFWQIAVRPATPQGAYPEDLLTAPQPPDGPRRWVCPLAVIDWGANNGGQVCPCCDPFDNLVTLSRRKPGCCTVAIGPPDITAAASLQTLIDRATAKAQAVVVCLSPGSYALPRPLRLDRRHAGITLQACGGPALLLEDRAADASVFADGLIVMMNVPGVTLRGLTLRPPSTRIPRALRAAVLAHASQDNLPNPSMALGWPAAGFGVRALDCRDLTLEGCAFDLGSAPAERGDDLFMAGVFVQGSSPGLVVHNCTFGSRLPPTFTPLTVDAAVASPAARLFDRVLQRFNPTGMSAPPAPAPPSPAPPPATAPAQPPRPAQPAQPARAARPLVAAPPPRAQQPAAQSPASGNAPARPPPPSAPAPPPASPAMPLAERISTAFEALIAYRQTLGAGTAPAMVATVGVVAADYSSVGADRDVPLSCAIGDAMLRDNAFTGLTFATWFSTSASTLRVQDNIVEGGVAGLWLERPAPLPPPRALPNTPTYYPNVEFFGEFMLASALAAALKPPSTQAIQSPNVKATPAATEFTMFVLGNKIETRAAAGTADNARSCSAALMLALNTGDTATHVSLIVSANHLRSAADAFAPTALIVKPPRQPCAITGNVVLNYIANADNKAIPSLWVISSDTQGLTVTGNSLSGPSDLVDLPARPGALPSNSWQSYNADPT